MADSASIPKSRQFQDLTGRRFRKLTVVSYAGKKSNHRWNCVCDCGGTAIVFGGNLRRANTTSCGCVHREKTGDAKRTHGKTKTSEYWIRSSMIARCHDPKAISYPNYGARGISVCDRWRFGENGKTGFECFFEDVGIRPSPEHSIERNDNDGNYEPGNCRWATRVEQARNSRHSRKILFRGKTLMLSEFAAATGISRQALAKRLDKGMSPEMASVPRIRRSL